MMRRKNHFTVYGKPKAQQRHRHTKSGRTYDPSAPDKERFFLQALQFKPKTPFQGCIAVECLFFMPRPKKHYGTGKNSHILKPSAPYEHITTPDADNLAKFVMDALGTGNRFFGDDKQVADLRSRKLYANNKDNERTLVWIYQIDKEDIEQWNIS